MKKIGIITHYYDSPNYGGCLQAYALCRVIRDMGYNCEQISYRKCAPQKGRGIKALAKRMLERVLYGMKFRERKAVFVPFREAIPHSETVYDAHTVSGCADKYDVFITGSDQVWNFKWYEPAFFLDFVDGAKTKLSYAASLGKSALSEEERDKIKKSLSDYAAVSVREQDAAEKLAPLTQKPVEWVLDPTLLLSREAWDAVASERTAGGRYLFCYFLGRDRRIRELATAYARAKGLTVVTMPHFPFSFVKNDLGFGDKKLYDVTPNDFIALIKNAECVFTDSFHAAVFSNLYEKDFFVFDRLGASEMNSRILTLLPLFGSESRFCCTEEHFTIEHCLNAPKIAYRNGSSDLAEAVGHSLDFLKTAIENGEISV